MDRFIVAEEPLLSRLRDTNVARVMALLHRAMMINHSEQRILVPVAPKWVSYAFDSVNTWESRVARTRTSHRRPLAGLDQPEEIQQGTASYQWFPGISQLNQFSVLGDHAQIF